MIIEIKNNYGTQCIYPVCETAQQLIKLTGKKTFSHADIKVIQSLGYTVTIKQAEITL